MTVSDKRHIAAIEALQRTASALIVARARASTPLPWMSPYRTNKTGAFLPNTSNIARMPRARTRRTPAQKVRITALARSIDELGLTCELCRQFRRHIQRIRAPKPQLFKIITSGVHPEEPFISLGEVHHKSGKIVRARLSKGPATQAQFGVIQGECCRGEDSHRFYTRQSLQGSNSGLCISALDIEINFCARQKRLTRSSRSP
jgi:hypothetical protein